MNISTYDKQLYIKHRLSGISTILRKSPFKHRDYDIFTIKNRILGSNRWVIKKLFEIDTQKRDIIPLYIKKHKRPELKKETAMHKDIAQFIIKNEQIII